MQQKHDHRHATVFAQRMPKKTKSFGKSLRNGGRMSGGRQNPIDPTAYPDKSIHPDTASQQHPDVEKERFEVFVHGVFSEDAYKGINFWKNSKLWSSIT